MGYRELIESLRKEGDEKVRDIWETTESEARRIRSEMTRNIEIMQEEFEKKKAAVREQLRRSIIAEAEKRSRKTRLMTETKLTERLYSLARSSLVLLRSERYAKVFTDLVRELPSISWHLIRVNPEDADIARHCFSTSEIIPDEGITGGIDVTSEDGRIRITNTLEKRLERIWNDLLPAIIHDIYRELSDERVPSES